MKYKLTDEIKRVDGRTLHRIECVTAFNGVNVGDKGGWIESEENLSQLGTCWVYDDAKIYDNAKLSDNACVYNEVSIYCNAQIYGSALISGYVSIYDDAEIYDNACIHDYATIFGDARIYGNANIRENAEIFGDAKIYGNADIQGDAEIFKDYDYIVIKNNWSSGRYFTYTASNKMWSAGCFYGTGKELIEKAYNDSELKGKCYEASVKYVEEIMELIKRI